MTISTEPLCIELAIDALQGNEEARRLGQALISLVRYHEQRTIDPARVVYMRQCGHVASSRLHSPEFAIRDAATRCKATSAELSQALQDLASLQDPQPQGEPCLVNPIPKLTQT